MNESHVGTVEIKISVTKQNGILVAILTGSKLRDTSVTLLSQLRINAMAEFCCRSLPYKSN